MKKIAIFFILISFFLNMSSQEKKKVFDIRRAYSYLPASLLIGESDLNCTFFISKRIRKDVVIVGAEQMYLNRNNYSDEDTLYINKGSVDGIKEGELWLVLGQGKRISDPFSLKTLGTYYLKKSLAKVTCVFEETAVITLTKGCYPVQIGDFLLPYKPEDTVFKKKIDYQDCKLPESPFEGMVVYNDLDIDFEREIAGTSHYLAVDLGKALVSKGDFLLFYKVLKKSLPPVITGLGIVVNPQNSNSTVKVIDASYPIEVGDRVVLLSEEPIEAIPEGERVPIVEALKGETVSPDMQKIESSILFDIDSNTVSAAYDGEFERIKEFIDSKTEFVIVLKGYACSIGDFEYNLKLSKDRVDVVKEMLITKLGIGDNFIETNFYGEKDCPFDNTSEDQRRKNRLVQIQVIGK